MVPSCQVQSSHVHGRPTTGVLQLVGSHNFLDGAQETLVAFVHVYVTFVETFVWQVQMVCGGVIHLWGFVLGNDAMSLAPPVVGLPPLVSVADLVPPVGGLDLVPPVGWVDVVAPIGVVSSWRFSPMNDSTSYEINTTEN